MQNDLISMMFNDYLDKQETAEAKAECANAIKPFVDFCHEWQKKYKFSAVEYTPNGVALHLVGIESPVLLTSPEEEIVMQDGGLDVFGAKNFGKPLPGHSFKVF